MEYPAPRSTGRRLIPILIGLIASVFVFLALYVILSVVVFGSAMRA